MTQSPPVTHAEAADFFDALTTACSNAGLKVEIVQRPSTITVKAPEAHRYMTETITLRPNAKGVLTWHWSWDAPIAPAHNIDDLVRLIVRLIGTADLR